MLKGLKILDFSHRLPGPLAGKLLADLGAEVIKVEDITHQDPFLSGFFASFDPSFKKWYEAFNHSKKLIRLNFNSPTIKDEIKKLLLDTDAVILSLSDKLKQKLGLTNLEIQSLSKPLSVVELFASQNKSQNMHDLNALAMMGILKLHTQEFNTPVAPPPFLPIAGIAFAQNIALKLMSTHFQSHKLKKSIITPCYLYEDTQQLFSAFYDSNKTSAFSQKFLHNGAYPCYALYRLKDQVYLAVACVEEKFWNNFNELFSLSIPNDKRFETSDEIFSIVSKKLANYTSSEVEEKIKNQDICLTLVK